MKSSKPIFKAHPSSLGKLMTGFKGPEYKEKLIEKIEELKLHRDEGINSKGNSVKWTENKKSEYAKLQSQLANIDDISLTAKRVAQEWMTEILYGRRKQIYTDAMHKGNLTENQGIEYINKVYGYSGKKNTERIENEWFTGECDVKIEDKSLVIDHKSSLDQTTFPLWEDEIPEDDYDWQVQGYADLYDVDNLSVIYTLQDTPDEIVEKYAKWESNRLGHDELDFEVFTEVKKIHTFSHLPDFLRAKRYDFKRDYKMISDARTQVERVRKYIESTPFYDYYNRLIQAQTTAK